MTASVADRNTPRRDGNIFSLPVKGAKKIYGGTLVAIDANGYAHPASDTAGLVIQGVSEEMVDNSAGADGGKTIQVRRSVFQFTSSGLTDADVGKPVYVADDQTVQTTVTTNKVMAGVLVDVESATKGWVEVLPHIGALVDSVTQADSNVQGVGYVQADVQSVADLSDAIKVTVNALIAELKKQGIIASA